jgi:hypothetical protein
MTGSSLDKGRLSDRGPGFEGLDFFVIQGVADGDILGLLSTPPLKLAGLFLLWSA